MSSIAADILRAHARPLLPQPTGLSPQLKVLPDIRVVLLDIYGTLVVSGCGDVGTEALVGRAEAIQASWAAVGLKLPVAAEEVVKLQETAILRHHADARSRGIENPEVNIVEIWAEVLRELMPDTGTNEILKSAGLERLAVEYEARVNPVWPMPGMLDCLAAVHGAGLLMGLVSNAQFYTRHLFSALAATDVEDLGIDMGLAFFSYMYGQAKPGRYLYERAAEALASRGIQPNEVLYMGNDMLKDILPAGQVGFRTALFAGDARSLRLREDDARVEGVQPDLVITELRQVVGCVSLLQG